VKAARINDVTAGNVQSDLFVKADGTLDVSSLTVGHTFNLVTLYNQVTAGVDNFTQTTSSQYPNFVLSGFGTFPVARFFSTAQSMLNGTINGGTAIAPPYTISCVAKRIANPTASSAMFGGGPGPNCTLFFNNVATQAGWWDGVSSILATQNDGTMQSFINKVGGVAGTAGLFYVSGSAASDSGSNGGGTLRATAMHIGFDNVSTFCDMDFLEVMVWNSDIDSSHVTALYNNQHTVWGV
jgi:hypothetical protein